MPARTISLITVIAIVFYTLAAADGVPENARSRSVIKRVIPALDLELSAKGLRSGSPIFIRIFKESSELELWIEEDAKYQLFRIYDICTFSGDLGPKIRQGDLQSPEGFYFVTPGQMNPSSRFHLSFNLGYPNAYDRQHDRSGSALMVHGNCVSIGCYAMTDTRIEEIYAVADAALRNGQPFFRVHIFPFRMTSENMNKHFESQWRIFWENLKDGYDWFERTGIPPNVEVRNGQYVFNSS
ncbi:MAG: murein L,D-transpeptidase [Candidatus Krumholzibacteria bacterium]|nr:murein L,D-transpeptidase [Candidatus Krumholzibacteria bacterium]